jgi:hypothetical protein
MEKLCIGYCRHIDMHVNKPIFCICVLYACFMFFVFSIFLMEDRFGWGGSEEAGKCYGETEEMGYRKML